MKRRITIFALSAMLFALCGHVGAQQSGKVARIGILDTSTASGSAILVDAFRQELTRFGWIEGKNIAFEYRFAEGKTSRLPKLAADLVRLNVDVIVATSTAPALAAKGATSTIPIVVTNAADPVAAGLIASLARPGANITGLSGLAVELNTKRLEILKDAVPKLTRVGLLRSAAGGVSADLQMKELRPVALALKLKLEEVETEANAKSLENAFQTVKQKQVNAIMTTTARGFLSERTRIIELAGKYRLAAIYFQREFVEDGGLMSYGADYEDLFRKAAHYVDKILKGSTPSALPVQQATKFEFVVNLKAGQTDWLDTFA